MKFKIREKNYSVCILIKIVQRKRKVMTTKVRTVVYK